MDYIEKIKSNIGPQIKKARIKAKMSQSELAIKCNLSKNSRFTIINWESGKTVPNFEQLCDLCKVFNCEMTFFFGDECTTRDIQFIHDVTGFSEPAIKKLQYLKEYGTHITEILDKLIQISSFCRMLELADRAVELDKQLDTSTQQEKFDAFRKVLRKQLDSGLLSLSVVPDIVLNIKNVNEIDEIVDLLAEDALDTVVLNRSEASKFYISESQKELQKAIDEIKTAPGGNLGR